MANSEFMGTATRKAPPAGAAHERSPVRGLLAIAVGAALAFAATPAGAETDEKDTVKKTWNVAAGHGSYSDAIPLKLPAFRSITPEFGLRYDSSSGNGALGVGWGLAGVSVVERASPGKGVPRYDDSDIFLLDGGELIPCAPDSVSPSCTTGGTHTTKIESYRRITKSGSGIASRWTITAKDGVRRVYAPVATVNGGPDVFRWGLSEVIDTRDNVVTYGWGADGFGCCWEHLDSISYSGTTVTIHYEARDDAEWSAMGRGSMRIARGRIQTIDIAVDGERVRAYRLKYVVSGPTGRSLLRSVQEYGTDATLDGSNAVTGGTSNPAITIEYNGESSSSRFETGTADSGMPSNRAEQVFAMDINGDGRTDTLELYTEWGQKHRKVWLSDGTQFVAGTDQTGMSASTSARFLPMDVNGDGMSDLVELYRSWDGQHCRIWLSDGTRFTEASDRADGMSTRDDARFLSMDINGDGMSDVVEFRLSERVFGPRGVRTWLSTGMAFDLASDDDFAWTDNGQYLPMDVNGDGKSDLVSIEPLGWRRTYERQIWLSNGTGFEAGPVDRPASGQVVETRDQDQSVSKWVPFLSMDVNGDGNEDMVEFDPGAFGSRIRRTWLSTGTSFVLTEEVELSFSNAGDWFLAMDLNGDGRCDVVSIESTGLGYEQRQLWLSNGEGFVAGPTDTQSEFGRHTEIMAADVNGDGLSEMISVAQITALLPLKRRIWPMAGPYPDLLASITGSMGGTTTVSYLPSSAWDNVNNPPLIQTVKEVTSTDGRGGTATARYEYSGGLHDRAEKRFLGFRHEYQTKPCIEGEASCPYAEIAYRQDLAAASKPERIDEYSGDGVLMRTQILEYTTNGDMVPRVALTTGEWDVTLGSGDTECPGAECRRKYLTRSFNAYGEVTRETDHGDSDLAGDEDTTMTTYVPNTAAYIVDKPARQVTFAGVDDAGERLLEQRWSYDGAREWQEAPAAGLETSQARWSSSTGDFVGTHREYDPRGNVTAQVDEVGARTEFEFDETHHLYRISTTNALGQATHTTWDPVCGAPTRATGLNGESTTLIYDALCRVTHKQGPSGRIERHAWMDLGDANTQHELVEVLGVQDRGPQWQRRYFDGLGRTWRQAESGPDAETGDIYVDKAYDARGQESSTTRPYYWKAGEPQPATYVTRTDYDVLGRPVRVTFPDGAYTTSSYGAWSVTGTDELGRAKTDRFDADDRPIAHEETVAGEVYTTTYLYDRRGNLAESRDPLGNVITSSTDSLGRRLAMIDPDWGPWSYEYDDAGRMTAKTDAKGQRTEFVYDALGRKISKTSLAGTQAAVTVTWTYDEVRDGYDNVGKLTSITDPAGGETFDHDVAGNLVKAVRTTDGERYAFEYGFDALGRKLWTAYPDGDTVGTADAPLEYDAAGRLTSIPGFVESAQYTAEGQLARLEATNGALTTKTYLPERGWLMGISTISAGETIQDLEHTRDVDGSILEVTSPFDDEGWTYAYDELNRLVAATSATNPDLDETFEYDAIGNVTWSARVGRYEYGPRPHAAVAAGSNTYSYDAAGLMTSRAGRTLTWDGDNRLVSVSPEDESAGPPDEKPGGMLTVPEPGGGAPPWLALGLLLAAVAWSVRWRRSAPDTPLPSRTRRLGWALVVPVTFALAISCKGDSASETGTDGGFSDGVPDGAPDGDPDGIPDDVPDDVPEEVPGGPDGPVRLAFGYDANDVRIRMVEGDVTRHYVGDDYEAAGGASIKYVTIAGSPVARLEGDKKTWVHTNHLGSVQAQTDALGNEVHRKGYRPYGEIVSTQGSLQYEPRGFTGQRHDASGLVYLHARYYDPALGRFISPDEIIDGTDTVGLNRYAYCAGDPVNHTDIDGRDKDDTDADEGRPRSRVSAQTVTVRRGSKGGRTLTTNHSTHFFAPRPIAAAPARRGGASGHRAPAGTATAPQVAPTAGPSRLSEVGPASGHVSFGVHGVGTLGSVAWEEREPTAEELQRIRDGLGTAWDVGWYGAGLVSRRAGIVGTVLSVLSAAKAGADEFRRSGSVRNGLIRGGDALTGMDGPYRVFGCSACPTSDPITGELRPNWNEP